MPLPDLLSDIEHLTGLDVEVLLRDQGRAHLDAFAAVVDDLAAGGAGPVELLDYLAAAADREDGLALGTAEPVPGRVQVLTVHAAKGLEWDIVALPHLCEGVFPGSRTTTWLGEAGRLPPGVRGDRDDLPELRLPRSGNQSDMVKALAAHVSDLKAAQLAEERRLMYVGVTRARTVLLLSAHHWGSTGQRPRGPGQFFQEIRDVPAAGPPEVDDPAPIAAAPNPLIAEPRTAVWPTDPVGARRPALEHAAAVVRRHLVGVTGVGSDGETGGQSGVDGASTLAAAPDPHGWQHDIDLLLAERAAGDAAAVWVEPPDSLSVSALVDLATDPDLVISRWRRPLPQPPAPQARRGTAFHTWVQRRYAGEGLVDIDDLPGAGDRDAAPDEDVSELIAAFRASPWSLRLPLAVEVPFSTVLAGVVVRGRIDAVFRDDDGGVTVVDWKTGAPPAGAAAEGAAVQLHAYRIAWSRLSGLPVDRVRAAFHYVASGTTVVPPPMDDVADFEEQIRRSLDVLGGGGGVET
jgi:DNA helicase-2/ATP-dependent DNA helicase PcrA